MPTCVVIGPPGTGKTYHLMHEIAPRELRAGVDPSRLGFFSFTKAAVNEARSRVAADLGLPLEPFSWWRTLHSACFALLGLKSDRVLSPKDVRAFNLQYRYDLTEENEPNETGLMAPTRRTATDELRACYAFARARLTPPRAAVSEFPGVDVRQLDEFVSRYETFKRARFKVDFDDFIHFALAQRLTPPLSVLIVDEAQDLSPAQIALVELWRAAAARTYIVGDPDQAIYGFQGAEPAWLNALAKDPSNAVRVLDQSFRVPASVHPFAQRVIRRNHDRLDAEYRPRRGDPGDVRFLPLPDAIEQVDPGVSTFMLCRTRGQVAMIANLLFEARLPYRAERGAPGPLGRKQLVAALRLFIDVASGRPVLAEPFAAAADYFLRSRRRKRGEEEDDGLLEYGAKAALERCDPHLMLDEAALARLGCRPLLDLLGPYHPAYALQLHTTPEEREYLRELVGPNTGWAIPEPNVTVTTIHGSKGREADHNFVLLELPPHIATSDDQEAENRALYVALTRTRSRLVLIQSRTAYGYSVG